MQEGSTEGLVYDEPKYGDASNWADTLVPCGEGCMGQRPGGLHGASAPSCTWPPMSLASYTCPHHVPTAQSNTLWML